ncbi:MAG: glycosyltransferase [Candidatus Hydrogenedentales bacterium]|jgi:colanic acid/amylovoran biosynthesis glycosyltransferase
MNSSILYIVGDYPVISEQFIRREVEGLVRLGMNIDVAPVCLHGLAWNVTQSRGAYRLFRRTWQSLRRDPRSPTLRQCLSATLRAGAWMPRARRAQHLHAHFLGIPALVAYCLSRELGIPYSLTAHAHDIYVGACPECVVRNAAFRTTCTGSNQRYLAACYPDSPFELVRHGIDVAQYSGQRFSDGDNTFRILAVGRLVEKKGFDYLIDACALLREDDMPFLCTLVGEGYLETLLRARIAELALENCVSLVPFRPHAELRTYYLRSDVLVAPSVVATDGDRDGLPNVILEAMASELPVIASDAGSIPEAVRDMQTGLLVPQGDAPALADALKRVQRDRALSAGRSGRALELVRTEFNEERWLRCLRLLFANARAETDTQAE